MDLLHTQEAAPTVKAPIVHLLLGRQRIQYIKVGDEQDKVLMVMAAQVMALVGAVVNILQMLGQDMLLVLEAVLVETEPPVVAEAVALVPLEQITLVVQVVTVESV